MCVRVRWGKKCDGPTDEPTNKAFLGVECLYCSTRRLLVGKSSGRDFVFEISFSGKIILNFLFQTFLQNFFLQKFVDFVVRIFLFWTFFSEISFQKFLFQKCFFRQNFFRMFIFRIFCLIFSFSFCILRYCQHKKTNNHHCIHLPFSHGCICICLILFLYFYLYFEILSAQESKQSSSYLPFSHGCLLCHADAPPLCVWSANALLLS